MIGCGIPQEASAAAQRLAAGESMTGGSGALTPSTLVRSARQPTAKHVKSAARMRTCG